MFLTVIIPSVYGLEIIYFAAFMLAMLGAMLLGRWTTKNLLIFIFWIAVVISLTKAAVILLQNFPKSYTVSTY